MAQRRFWVVWLVAAVLSAGLAGGADWPVYLGDGGHSGVCGEAIEPASRPAFVIDTGAPPSPGFYPDLRASTLGPQKILASATTYDYAYAPVVAEGRLFFGSSTHEAVFCHDARSGARLWTFYAQGAVRFAPAVSGGRVYFGSDDGHVYCVEAASGRLVWKYAAGPGDRRVIANGRVASQWPVRTSVLVAGARVYSSAGLFPADGGVYLFCLNAADGSVVWRRAVLTPSQGYLMIQHDTLVVPTGRASPIEHSLNDGSPVVPVVSDLRREGGAAFLSVMGDVLVNGPTEFGILRFRVGRPAENAAPVYRGVDEDPKRALRGPRTGLAGWRVVADREMAWLLREGELLAMPCDAFRRTLQESAEQFGQRVKEGMITTKSGVQLKTDSKAEKEMAAYAKWKADIRGGRSLIKCGNMVVAGGEGEVRGWNPADGAQRFSAAVEGVAWELAAADGRLYVSTSAGKVYCFGPAAEGGAGPARPADAPGWTDDRRAVMKQYAAAALAKAGRKRGFCVLAGAGEGLLAAELARQSEMRVLCIERDDDAAARARQNLAAAGLYGSRVTVHTCAGERLPYVDYFANLVVSESFVDGGKPAFAAGELARLLAPYGGVMAAYGPPGAAAQWHAGAWAAEPVGGLELATITRGPLPGAGAWTHMFADPANTANSGDSLVGGTQYRLQWFGDPSPPKNAGWHANGMGPLARDGRLFVIKIDHLEAVDAYNGTSLWSLEVPGMARFSPGREGGAACVDDRHVYVAVKHDARAVDVTTGKVARTLTGPDEKSDWGYIAVTGDVLLGSMQNPGATVTSTTEKNTPLKSFWGASEAEFVVSHTLFALDKASGRPRWTYRPGGRSILNSTIAADDRRVYFIESRAKAIADDADGSVGLRDFMAGEAFLVALDLADGKAAWETPLEFGARTMLYLSVVKDTLVLASGYHIGPLAQTPPINAATSELGKKLGLTPDEARKQIEETKIRFAFRALDAGTGTTKWDAEYTSSDVIGTQHNYNVSHPVVTEKAIYHNPAEQYLVLIDMASGKLTERKEIARGKGCATPTGSARAIFYRSLGIASYDFESGKQVYVSDVSRPSCWMNVLPAGGLLLMPEYSIGCNCAFPLQTTIVLAPGQYDHEPDVSHNKR